MQNIPFETIPSPCFLLHESLLRRNLELMKRVQAEAGINIILALKGFSMFSAFPLIKKYLPGTTASSLHEARLGFEEFGGEVHAYSPAYLDHEFEEMMQYCDHLSFNSVAQFEKFYPLIKDFTTRTGKHISAGLRINPEYSEVETDLYNPCIPGSRLGTRAENLQDDLPIGIDFLHVHNLCESSSFALEKTLENVERLFGTHLHKIKLLNMGGGHLMTREGYDVEHLINTLKNFKAKYPNLKMMLEPGSAVAWQTGYLVTRVLDIVNSAGIEVAIVDASVSAHMPDVIEMPYKPKIMNADSTPVKGKPTYRFGGLTCLAGDFVGDYSFDKPLEIGDLIIWEDMMHYTMVKTTTFNGVQLPSIGIWKESNFFQMVKTFGYEDFRNRLS